MPSRGRSLPREVQEQLQVCDRVIAVMGSQAIASEACQAERAFAVNAGKVVIAILREGEYRMLPLELSRYFVPDFRASRSYGLALDELRRVLQDEPVVPARLFDVPALPPHIQPRPDELRALRESVTAAELKETTAITSAGHVGVQGMGGVGKTVMAALAARDYIVRRQFRDGIIWLTFGREPNVLREVRRALEALGRDTAKHYDVSLARMELGQALEGRECLLILDDVWSAADAEPFVRAINFRCRLLITTRNLDVVDALGARNHPLDVLTEDQSRGLLARWCNLNPDALPSEAPALIQGCGRLPLALAMIGAMLRGKPHAFWKHVHHLLRDANLERIKAKFPEYPYPDMLRAMQVSVDALSEEDRVSARRYLALAVMPEDMAIAPVVQQTLWNVNEREALDTAERLVGRSLAQRDGDNGSIRLHDLQLDYVRARYPHRKALDLIHGAVRLSGHVIAEAPQQFASQAVGRLLPYRDLPAIRQFINKIARGAPAPWVRPLWPALRPPGTGLIRTLKGHSAPVSDVVACPDGRCAVSASHDQTLRVWDLETGRHLRTLEAQEPVYSVAVSPDGRKLISSSRETSVQVCNLDTGGIVLTLEGHRHYVTGLAVTPDGCRLVSASMDQTLKVWDLETGQMLRTLTGYSDSVHSAAVSPDGRHVISASGDKTLKVWDLENGHILNTLTAHVDQVIDLAITPDGREVISASYDKALIVWDLGTGQIIRTLKSHSAAVLAVAISPDGRHLVSGSADQTLKIWDLKTGIVLRTLAGHFSSVDSVAVSPDGRRVVSASSDNSLTVWDLEPTQAIPTMEGHAGLVSGVATTLSGRRIVSASKDMTLKVWDVGTGCVLRTLKGHSAAVNSVAISSDEQFAVSASEDTTIKVWDVETGLQLRTLDARKPVHAVAIFPDRRRVLSASYGLKIWSVKRSRALRTFGDRGEYVSGVAITCDGQRVLSHNGGGLKIWKLEDARVLSTIGDRSGFLYHVAVSPDEQYGVLAYGDGRVEVRDLATGQVVQMLQGSSDYANALAVSPDGRFAISASSDNTVKVWDWRAGTLVATFTCDAAPQCCVFGGPCVIVVGDRAGRVHLLSLELGNGY